MKQSDFLRDEFMMHQGRPTFTGHQEYEQHRRAQLTSRLQTSVVDWCPPEPPSLDAEPEIFLDFESTGLRWWAGDLPIGVGVYLPNSHRSLYLPWGHRGGQNLDEAIVRRWFERELRGKRVTNIRLKFDLHLARAWGVDLEAQGCTFGDVAHYAALLDDHRRLFNQADLAHAYLGGAGKVTTAHGFELDPSHFADYPAGIVAPRAENDVETVFRLQQAMWPKLTEQDLHRVREVEDAVIPAVVEMEHNGAPLDVELLNDWCQRSERDVEDALWEIQRQTGCRLETPNKRSDILKLFATLRIPMPRDAETDKPTIADDALATYDHPVLLTLRRAIALASLRSKFLLKYQRSVSRDGILRYELHQLPYQDDAEGRGGAVSGRFSSAAMTYYDEHGTQQSIGANIQQVFGVKTQEEGFTGQYLVKRLFKPANGMWLSSDARQIEYRLFAHYAQSQPIIAAYRHNPLTDYHVLVHDLIQGITHKDFSRVHVKRVNFSQIYGAGMLKLALLVGEISPSTYTELREIQRQNFARMAQDPRVQQTLTLYTTYHKTFPEVKRLLQHASRIAEQRGYVFTHLGRRARFSSGDRMYSALNRIIQGSAADVMKRVLIEVHQRRKEIGFVPRFCVHDSLDGDLLDIRNLDRLRAILDEQYDTFRVPLLWHVALGPTWADAT